MEKYTARNFYKYQHAIFKYLDKTKQPVEITEDGTNKGYILISKAVYQQLKTTQDGQLQQAESNIRRYALHHDPKTPVNNDEMEKWLSDDS